MDTHQLDPVALIFGLLFALTGAAVMTDRATEGLDVTAITSVGVAVVGVILVAMIILRLIRDEPRPDPASGSGPGPDSGFGSIYGSSVEPSESAEPSEPTESTESAESTEL